jgi:hypothetical protein
MLVLNETAKNIGQAVLGVAIAVGGALAWRFWDIDGYIAFVVVLSGLGMAAHAFGYNLN